MAKVSREFFLLAFLMTVSSGFMGNSTEEADRTQIQQEACLCVDPTHAHHPVCSLRIPVTSWLSPWQTSSAKPALFPCIEGDYSPCWSWWSQAISEVHLNQDCQCDRLIGLGGWIRGCCLWHQQQWQIWWWEWGRMEYYKYIYWLFFWLGLYELIFSY